MTNQGQHSRDTDPLRVVGVDNRLTRLLAHRFVAARIRQDLNNPIGKPGDVVQTAGDPVYELTVVVPTFNEAANVEPLIRKLETALADAAK